MAFRDLCQGLPVADRRRADREEVYFRTVARLATGAAFPIELVNLSRVGCMARTHVATTPGTRLKIVVPPQEEVRAKVVWALGGRIGCEFDEPIAAVRFFELLAALPKG